MKNHTIHLYIVFISCFLFIISSAQVAQSNSNQSNVSNNDQSNVETIPTEEEYLIEIDELGISENGEEKGRLTEEDFMGEYEGNDELLNTDEEELLIDLSHENFFNNELENNELLEFEFEFESEYELGEAPSFEEQFELLEEEIEEIEEEEEEEAGVSNQQAKNKGSNDGDSNKTRSDKNKDDDHEEPLDDYQAYNSYYYDLNQDLMDMDL